MHSIYEKELSLIFLFICTCWSRHSIVPDDHSDSSRSVCYEGATGEKWTRCSCCAPPPSQMYFGLLRRRFMQAAQRPWCPAPAVTGRRIHPRIQNSTSWHKGRNSATVSKGTPSSCCFCAFHNNWDSGSGFNPRSRKNRPLIVMNLNKHVRD